MRRIGAMALSLALAGGAGTAAWAQVAVPAAQQPSPLEAVKEQADAAYRQREFETAIKLTNQVLAQAPTDHVALYLRGSSRIEMGIINGRMELIRQGIGDSREALRSEGKGNPDYYLPYMYGMSHLAGLEGKPDNAKASLQVADGQLEREDLTPEQRANVHYQRAHANIQLKDLTAAGADAAEAIKLQPKHLAAHMLAADIAVLRKQPADAVNAFNAGVRAFPENPVVYNNRGMYLRTLEKNTEAMADFNRAIQLDSKFIPAYINRGFALLETGDAAGAETSLSHVLTIDPDQPGALSLRATARLNQNRSNDAIADYRKVAQMAQQNPLAQYDLGFALFFTGSYQDALTQFDKALALDKQLRFLLPWKLACEIRLQKVDNAAYQEILSKPEAGRDWVDNLVLFELGRVDAKALLQAAHPTDKTIQNAQLCEGYYFIGNELQRRGRGADAVAYWQAASKQPQPKLSAYRGAMFALTNSGAVTK